MINKALLDPWVRQQMDRLLEFGRASGFEPVVTSGWRSFREQERLFLNCVRAMPGQTGYPVALPGCSQHEYGLAFDLKATRAATVMGDIPTRGRILLCALLPQLCRFDQEIPFDPPDFEQNLLGTFAKGLGLKWARSDPIHFSACDPATWRLQLPRHCKTCTYPGGLPEES